VQVIINVSITSDRMRIFDTLGSTTVADVVVKH